MGFILKPGMRVFSAIDSTEMIAVKAPSGPIDLTLGGARPVLAADQRTTGVPLEGHDAPVLMGKRYVDAHETIELLATKAGVAAPALAGEPLLLKQAKPLPASD